MKRTARMSGWIFGLLTVALVAPVLGQAQRGVWESIAVQDLKARCGAMDRKLVQLIGHVSTVDYAEAAQANRYILNGYKGGTITVQTTRGRPLPTMHVFIRGTVGVDAMGDCFLVEAERYLLDEKKVAPLLQEGLLSAIDTIAANPVVVGPDGGFVPGPPIGGGGSALGTGPEREKENWVKIGIIGVAAILILTAIVIFLIVALRPKPQPVAMSRPSPTPGPMIESQGPAYRGPAQAEEDDEITIVRKGGEVRQIVDEKTIIPLPGWLEVLAGGQAVSSKIRLIGPQHALIGRKSKESRGVNFIALEMDDLTATEQKTLSRKQVKIAYDKANDEFTVENVGTVGTLVRLDGGDLPAGHSAPLTDGMTLTMEPYWEFRFHKGRPI